MPIQDQDLLSLALKAHIPIVAVRADDPLNSTSALQLIAKKPIAVFVPNVKTIALQKEVLYYTSDDTQATPEVYERFHAAETTLVILNPGSNLSTLAFHVGDLPTPPQFILDYLRGFLKENEVQAVFKELRGLTLKFAAEVMQLVMAQTGSAKPEDVRKMRRRLRGNVAGLEQMPTEYKFYQWPPHLSDYVADNKVFFLEPNVPKKVRPRGIMMAGTPGLGKTMSAKVIARDWGVPLYRLDLSSILIKWIGESERKMSTLLSELDKNEPCVLLIDEMEKLFRGDVEGTTSRLLAQLLWWMSEHESRVFVVGTTNHLDQIPPELYREGRMDAVFHVQRLSLPDARHFALNVFQEMMGRFSSLDESADIYERLGDQSSYSHSQVESLVYALGKSKGWLTPNLTN